MKLVTKAILIGIFTFFSCQDKKTQTDIISIIHEYGDGGGIIIIGEDERKIDSLCKAILSDPAKSVHFRSVQTYKISLAAIAYISEYVQANCCTDDQSKRKALASFIVNTYPLDSQSCYYYNKKEVVDYFSGMINWIEQSKFREECKAVLEQLQLYVNPH